VQALEALASPGSTPFSLVISDVQMPEMDGFQLTREIARRWPALPVIGLSANATDADLKRGKQAGMRAYLTKPIDPELLFRTLVNFRSGTPATPAPEAIGAPVAPAVAPSLSSVLDFDQLILQFRGNVGFVSKLLDAALNSNRTMSDELRQSAAQADWAELARVAHRARGMAGSIRAGALQQLAGTVENLARESAPDALVQAETLAAGVDALQQHLERHLAVRR
jgi:two-component system sensor histidine kinase/response regulator